MQDLLQHLALVLGQDLSHHRLTPVSGGDINRAYRLQTPSFQAFLKINRSALAEMLSDEVEGLQALAASSAVKVPQVLAHGSVGQHAYLLLEYLPLTALTDRSASLLGVQMARMHQQTQSYFGWHRNNTIGFTPQSNLRDSDWVRFWGEQRLGKQLTWAAEKGYAGALQNKGAKLIAALPTFFTDYQPHPSLLHGDCWGGNAAQDQQGRPVLYDPACYWGDREADLAMTELFGGFGPNFYAAYQSEYPLDPGYGVRKYLYNLYHILNHLNMFGGGYQAQALQMMERLLAEV